MTEKESNLVNALAGKQCPARDGMPEALHRRQLSVRDPRIALVKHRKGGAAEIIGRVALRGPQSAADVGLANRSPVRVENTKSPACAYRAASLWRTNMTANSCGIGTVRADPSVFVGRRRPWRSTWWANWISASARSSNLTSPQVRARSSDTRAPVRAARMNSVRHGTWGQCSPSSWGAWTSDPDTVSDARGRIGGNATVPGG
jgi:hypothetical protein